MGEISVSEGGADQDAFAVLDAIQIDQMQQEQSETFGDRTCAEHLRQCGIAFALEGQPFNQPDCKMRNFHYELAQNLTLQMDGAAVAAGNARPLVDAATEYL